MVEISSLPKEKNIVEFSDDELFLWFKDHVRNWASSGVGPKEYYEAVKTEIVRRNNERILDLTRRIHWLTVVLVFLAIIQIVMICVK